MGSGVKVNAMREAEDTIEQFRRAVEGDQSISKCWDEVDKDLRAMGNDSHSRKQYLELIRRGLHDQKLLPEISVMFAMRNFGELHKDGQMDHAKFSAWRKKHYPELNLVERATVHELSNQFFLVQEPRDEHNLTFRRRILQRDRYWAEDAEIRSALQVSKFIANKMGLPVTREEAKQAMNSQLENYTSVPGGVYWNRYGFYIALCDSFDMLSQGGEIITDESLNRFWQKYENWKPHKIDRDLTPGIW